MTLDLTLPEDAEIDFGDSVSYVEPKKKKKKRLYKEEDEEDDTDD